MLRKRETLVSPYFSVSSDEAKVWALHTNCCPAANDRPKDAQQEFLQMMVGDHRIGTLIEVFNNHEAAWAAVRELKAVGFSDSQIRIVLHPGHVDAVEQFDEKEAAEGAKAGTAAGIGVGALWGFGVLAGIAPDLSPVIGGGALGVFLSATAAGGTAGALVRLHVPHSESHRRKSHFMQGHTIVTVKAGTRADIASSVLNRFNRPERFVPQAM